MISSLRHIAREFLGREEAVCFLGWEEAPGGGGTRPAVIRDPAGVERLVWNRECFANLATYLPRYRELDGVVGIAVKGCDARAVRNLLGSRQATREKLYVIGVPCTGLAGPDGESLAARCHGCRYPEGFEYDAVLGPMQTPDLPEPPDELADMSLEERRRFWEAELDKCLRCDACRKICYGCFCPECFFESAEPRWISGRKDFSEKLFFHAVRAYHLAGRCVGCGECQRACPAGVRLDLLNRSLRDAVGDNFQFPGAGLTEADPPLQTFCPGDPEPSDRRRS